MPAASKATGPTAGVRRIMGRVSMVFKAAVPVFGPVVAVIGVPADINVGAVVSIIIRVRIRLGVGIIGIRFADIAGGYRAGATSQESGENYCQDQPICPRPKRTASSFTLSHTKTYAQGGPVQGAVPRVCAYNWPRSADPGWF